MTLLFHLNGTFSIFVKTSNGTQLVTATKIIEKCESLSKISLCKQILVFKHSKSIKLCFVFKKKMLIILVSFIFMMGILKTGTYLKPLCDSS